MSEFSSALDVYIDQMKRAFYAPPEYSWAATQEEEQAARKRRRVAILDRKEGEWTL